MDFECFYALLWRFTWLLNGFFLVCFDTFLTVFEPFLTLSGAIQGHFWTFFGTKLGSVWGLLWAFIFLPSIASVVSLAAGHPLFSRGVRIALSAPCRLLFIDVKPVSTYFRHIFLFLTIFLRFFIFVSFGFFNLLGRCFTGPLGHPATGS